jgi:hypothetical protein
MIGIELFTSLIEGLYCIRIITVEKREQVLTAVFQARSCDSKSREGWPLNQTLLLRLDF